MVTPLKPPWRFWAASANLQSVAHADRERLEAALVLALCGHVVQALFGDFDLNRRRLVDVAFVGAIDHVLAETDQLTAQIEIVDKPPVLAGVDDGDGGFGKLHQIARPAYRRQLVVLREITLQGYRIGDPLLLDQLRTGFEDRPVLGDREMFRTEELRNPLVGAFVHEDRAEQRLLRLDVVRGAAEPGGRVAEAGEFERSISGGGDCHAAESTRWRRAGVSVNQKTAGTVLRARRRL